jgi:hypothetical protein
MDNRHERAKAMRAEGKTYRAIGEALGVTRQRAKQLVQYVPGDYLHVYALWEIPYKGLREWMLANRVSIKELGVRCGCVVERVAKGGGCNKRTIDAILRVTGLDYETCFEESPAEVD